VGVTWPPILLPAPVVFCLNEQERPVLSQSANLEAQALYFLPQDINNGLSFEAMHAEASQLSLLTIEERFWFRAFLDRPSGASLQITLGPATAHQMAQLFEKTAFELTEQPLYWRCRARSFLLEIVFFIERLYTEALGERSMKATLHPQTAPERDRRVLPPMDDEMERLLLYLHTHYHEKLTIAELSRAFHTNRTTLATRFNRVTGEPLMAYLISLRIRLAELMLRDTTLPVEEVMNRVGYTNSSHFGRMFRRHTGCSPSEYRHRYCWLLRPA
jgi:AraC-like DNA-binding protein